MTSALSTIAPREIWTHFEALNAIPRGSKKEAAVIEFIQNFGAELGLETQTDGVGNVLIKTSDWGYESPQDHCDAGPPGHGSSKKFRGRF